MYLSSQDVIIRIMEKYRVLLADDHAVVRAGIRNVIEKLPGVTVEGEADDGPTLMQSLKELTPDILLIDVTMPDFEPITAIHQIRKIYPKMKILVISAYDDDVYVQGLLSAGVDGYHLKDQPLQDLNLAIERIIEGKRWISSSLVDKLVKIPNPDEDTAALTSRQREILALLNKGWNNQKIAYELGLSIKTIENHLTRIYRNLNVQSRLEAVNYINKNPHVLCYGEGKPDKQINSQFALSHPSDILLVDDNPRFRYHLRRIINKLFSQVTIHEAESIEDAINAVKAIQFQLIFIDVILGEQNGIDCTKRLKSETKNSRIVLISAYPDKEFHRQGLAAGATAFIDKKTLDSVTIKQIVGDAIHSSPA
jgi:DNA-binding NarL/FixJ family response regulator